MNLRRTTMAVATLTLGASSMLACSASPSRSGLITKLRQENGLTAKQAECVAGGLYDGVPHSGGQVAIRPLTAKELRTIAKPDNAGKVSAEVVQTLRDVVSSCLPTNVQPVNP